MYTRIKTTAEIDAMRTGGKMLATVLVGLKGYMQSGMSTKDLAEFAKKELHALGGKPAFLGYQGFPDVLCVSVNEQVVHGLIQIAKDDSRDGTPSVAEIKATFGTLMRKELGQAEDTLDIET